MATLPPMQVYDFETQFEMGVQAWLLVNGVNEVKKQREDKIDTDGGKKTLRTPRVEARCLFQGFGPNEHYHIGTDNRRWLDIGKGTLYLKIVTRRDEKDQIHSALRGLCRYLMQQVPQISAMLKYHKVEKMIEQNSTVTLEADKNHDVSALSFDVWLRIRPEHFPTS